MDKRRSNTYYNINAFRGKVVVFVYNAHFEREERSKNPMTAGFDMNEETIRH
ncbi:hypothetical protein [Desulfosporosinus sp. SB140]|uniref:hypothetical protein n=1 Tax=Desulfosporosinus paludis TaxID=3115649 RepID=UPI00388D0AC5